ncbi:hypothetical protein EPA93_48040 [Ktedonosporobacter rubrisoli]|uniref:Exo-alpha-sialidase n=1 Tax=Ktedonosporobacter rubrisoli TaxID=2509675 RepID=A0A4P6K6Q4_KTERU|nr:hypothetical protein [Ktedonosporobacter rubrisoli]QBD83306.1 hypothetical protein EPA93_48040 [Ktedonosporobacter rubrisoli]
MCSAQHSIESIKAWSVYFTDHSEFTDDCAGCLWGSDIDATTTATSISPPVNGFGTAANHPHSLLVLPNHVLLLATHYGFFRSEDGGISWKEMAGGSGEVMEELMTYSLTSSPLDHQRLYVLAEQVTSTLKSTPGLYSSSDQGRSWKMLYPSSASGNMFMVAAGNDNPNEVYIYLDDLGALGLKVSKDGGHHFTSTGKLPFSSFTQLLAIPGAPGHLLVASSGGGAHWQVNKEITGGILSLTTSGPGGPIYASGDEGIYVSHNGGTSFTLVYNKSSLGEIVVAPTQPETLYAKTGTALYRSTDGGHTWADIPRVKGSVQSGS